MRRPLIAIMLMLCMTFLSISYATPTVSGVTENQIEIISPEVTAKGDVIVDRSLYLSIRLLTDQPLVMTLTKLDKTVGDREQIMQSASMTSALSSPLLVSLIRFKEHVSQLSTYKTLASGEQLSYKKEILRLYDEVSLDYLAKKIIFEDLNTTLKAKFGVNVLTIANEKPDLDERLPQLLKASESFRTIEQKYKAIKPLYDQLLETVVLDQIPVELEGIMPYFNYDFKDPKSGEYRLSFYKKDSLELPVKVLRFTVMNRQSAVKNIIDGIQQELDGLWKVTQ